MNFWESMKSWMGDGFSIFVYVAIVAMFVIGIAKCVLPVLRTSDLLRRAVKNIRKGDKARRSWQEDRFLGRGALMPHWSEYLNNLFFADGEYHNPSNVEDYINEETVIDGPGSVHLSEALPGVMTSLGFLGTLLGLSVSLSGMSGVDADAVSASMDILLSSMKYAFLTSIFGVVGSILFTLLTRIVHGRASRALTDFYNAMARYAGVLSVDPMTQIAIYQQEQTGLMKSMLEALDPEKQRQRLREALEESVLPLAGALREHLDISSQAQAKLMDDVADAYIRKMNEAVHGQFDRLSSAIADTCHYQEKTIKGVGDALSSFGDAARAMRDIRQQSEAVLAKYETALNRIAQAQARNEDAAVRVDGVIQTQSEYMSMLAGLGDEFARQNAAIGEATNLFIENATRLNRENADAMNEASARIGESGEKLTGAMQDAREKLTKDMDESLNYFEGCMTEILKRIDWSANAVKDSVEGLPEAVRASSEQYLREIDALAGAVRAARNRISRASGADE